MKFYSIFSELLIIWKQFVEIIRNMLPKKIKIYFPGNSQIATHSIYYALMKLGNIIRVATLNLNFSIKDTCS